MEGAEGEGDLGGGGGERNEMFNVFLFYNLCQEISNILMNLKSI